MRRKSTRNKGVESAEKVEVTPRKSHRHTRRRKKSESESPEESDGSDSDFVAAEVEVRLDSFLTSLFDFKS